MRKKSAHPGKQLFEYLNGSLDDQAGRAIEDHLSGCADCASAAELTRGLKIIGRKVGENLNRSTGSADPKSSQTNPHPDVSELASFFYSKSARTRNAKTAAHVALCQSCALELAEYARAQRLASEYSPAQAQPGEVPHAAWDMIIDWEESSFAKPRSEAEAIGNDILAKLASLLSERRDQLQKKAHEEITRAAGAGEDSGGHFVAETPDLVPVIIIDQAGDFHGVEMFERSTDTRGNSILQHVEKSERFDNKPVHVLLDFGEEKQVVISDLIRRGTIRLRYAGRSDSELRRADYFIIED